MQRRDKGIIRQSSIAGKWRECKMKLWEMEKKKIGEYGTRCGFSISESLELLNQSILKGDLQNSVDIAYDLYRTSPRALREVWKQLTVTAVCEIGLAAPYAPAYISNMRDICYHTEPYMPEEGGMQALCFIHSIRFLCKCLKDSSLKDMEKFVKESYENGSYAVIPDFAVDHHNHAGREIGHTPLDFLEPEGGSKVLPEIEGAAPYKARLKELLTPMYGGENPKRFIVSMYNHFYDMESPHGLNLELMQSAFQKSIRRGLEKEALLLAYEGFLSGEEMEDYLWERIVIMSVEDIGMGDPECSRLMYSYVKLKEQFINEEETRFLLFMQAVRVLCRSPKERSTELMKGILVQEHKQQKNSRCGK